MNATTNRRGEIRLLCSDLVQMTWKDGFRQTRKEFAVLENVSRAGASLLAGVPIANGTRLRLVAPNADFTGVTRYCNHVTNGYLVGVSFDVESLWSENKYVPEHLLDPRELEEKEE